MCYLFILNSSLNMLDFSVSIHYQSHSFLSKKFSKIDRKLVGLWIYLSLHSQKPMQLHDILSLICNPFAAQQSCKRKYKRWNSSNTRKHCERFLPGKNTFQIICWSDLMSLKRLKRFSKVSSALQSIFLYSNRALELLLPSSRNLLQLYSP